MLDSSVLNPSITSSLVVSVGEPELSLSTSREEYNLTVLPSSTEVKFASVVI